MTFLYSANRELAFAFIFIKFLEQEQIIKNGREFFSFLLATKNFISKILETTLNKFTLKYFEVQLPTNVKNVGENAFIHINELISYDLPKHRNLTYKHLMGYSFVVKHCPDVDFIVKTDDDMFVDLPGILDMRTTEFETHGNGTDGRQTSGLFDIYCHNYYLDKPSRDPSDKWFSTREEWPEDTYPTYCLGNDYAISMEYLKKIYSVRHLGGFFWVDDVFIMGKLREIVEKTYNKSTNMLNMRAFGKTTDPRSEPSYIKDNCDSFRFGWFVFLDRSSEHFLLSMECLWRKVKTNMYINQALIVSMSMP